MANASYPSLPITQQPLNPHMSFEGFYLDNHPPPVILPNGDTSQALEFLKNATHLKICQKLELIKLTTGFETENKYTILNELNQPVFYAMEKSKCCARQFCGPARAMQVRVLDVFQNEVLHLHRPLACQLPCCWCCLQTMEVAVPPETVISTIEQCPSIKPKFNVTDPTGKPVLQIDGPLNTFSCGSDVKFSIKSIDGSEIGTISKKYGGFIAECFTDSDNFEVSFPKNLSLNQKLVILGAVFLMDMMFYEKKPKTSLVKNLVLGVISLLLYFYAT